MVAFCEATVVVILTPDAKKSRTVAKWKECVKAAGLQLIYSFTHAFTPLT